MWTGDGRPVTATPAATVPDVRDAATLKPGGSTWHPERAPSGPVVIIVSVPEQRAYVYRNGAFTVSTGKPGSAHCGLHHRSGHA
jgi:hypothetical protein